MKSRHWLNHTATERYMFDAAQAQGDLAWKLGISGALMSRMMLPAGHVRRLPISSKTRRRMIELIPDAAMLWIVEDSAAPQCCPHCGCNLNGNVLRPLAG